MTRLQAQAHPSTTSSPCKRAEELQRRPKRRLRRLGPQVRLFLLCFLLLFLDYCILEPKLLVTTGDDMTRHTPTMPTQTPSPPKQDQHDHSYAQYLPLACEQLLAGWIVGSDAQGPVGPQREGAREDGRG
jgi:hypothetical protein